MNLISTSLCIVFIIFTIRFVYWCVQRNSGRAWYVRQLKRPEWIELVSSFRSRHAHECAVCGRADRLALHHRFYVRGRRPWEYPDWALEFRCGRHHPRGAPVYSRMPNRWVA